MTRDIADAEARWVVCGRGQASGAVRRDRFQGAAVKAIRYADPAAWLVANAIADATGPLGAVLTAGQDRVGVVVTSADGAVEATAAMCQAAREGSSSPIRFPASNAGSLAGLSSIAFGFRGPTLMLTMTPARGVPVALLLAEAWLRRGVADHVVVAAHATTSGARCLLLSGSNGVTALDAAFSPAQAAAWLGDATVP